MTTKLLLLKIKPKNEWKDHIFIGILKLSNIFITSPAPSHLKPRYMCQLVIWTRGWFGRAHTRRILFDIESDYFPPVT